MSRVKLQLSKSQWEAMMLVINRTAPKLTNDIDDLAIKEQLQKTMLRLINKLPAINGNTKHKKYYTLNLTTSESWAFIKGPCCNYYGHYETLTVETVRNEIYKQIA